MGASTLISWTDSTFNCWSGCSKVHTGCKFCYAEVNYSVKMRGVKWGPNGTRVKTANWSDPLKWNKQAAKEGVRKRVFCASLADVFEDWTGPIHNHKGEVLMKQFGTLGTIVTQVTMDDLRRDLFMLIDATPNLDWQLLTKRPENVRRMLVPHCLETVRGHVSQNEGDGKRIRGRENIWLGTSVSDQETAEQWLPKLLKNRDLAKVLFLSVEPLVGPIEFDLDLLRHLDWLIIGGESGHHARPCDVRWIRNIIGQCRGVGVPCFVKQLGTGSKGMSIHDLPRGMTAFVKSLEDSKGGDMDYWPEYLRVREFPEVVHA